MVRCGRCATVFDGFKTLAALREDTPPAADTVRDATVIDALTRPSVGEMPISPPEPPTAATVPAEPSPPPAIEPEPPPVAAHEPEPVATPKPPPAATPKPQPARVAVALDEEPVQQRRSAGWSFGVLLLLTALAAQGAYFYRGEIAAGAPDLRPYLAKLCEVLHCTVILPQRPRQISIEASDMQAIDPANPGLIVLTATLRNQAATALSYPALDVVLTNTKEHTVARRIFLPTEYLEAGKDARAGIPPNAEITVRLNLDSGDLGAAGFRLDLLAAPLR